MPDSKDRLMYLCGGEIDSGEFSLDITCDDLQPTEITRLLGIQPTSHHLRGDTFGKRGHTYKFGRWRYATARLHFHTGRCFEEEFDAFVRGLPDDPVVWEGITRRYEAGILVCLWMRTWNREFDISTFAVSELARRRLRLHIDTYFKPDEYADDGSPRA